MRRRDIYFVAGAAVLVLLGIYGSMLSAKRRARIHNENRARLSQTADSLLQAGLNLIRAEEFDSASGLFALVMSLKDGAWSPPAIDSANRLLEELETFKRKRKEESVRDYLMAMTDEECTLLQKNQLSKQYFTNVDLNQAFLTILKQSAHKRQRYISEDKARRAKEEKERKLEEARSKADALKAEVANRKSYGAKLREHYLDQNMDIKVSVYGPNNTYIKLTFVLFDDVWTHKMSKGSLIDEIRSLGFKKLVMSDGYDYSVYWDF